MATPVVGVTGTIGVGKSTFSKFLAEEGGEHLDADVIARDLMQPGHAGYEPVIEEFGTYITDEEGYINPRIMAEEVFSDVDKLRRLENIIHPLVHDYIKRKVSSPKKSFYVIDAPLLFEANIEDLCHWVICITAPNEIVEERVDPAAFDKEEVRRRRDMQLSKEKKKKRADQVIDNRGSIKHLRRKAREVALEVQDLGLLEEKKN